MHKSDNEDDSARGPQGSRRSRGCGCDAVEPSASALTSRTSQSNVQSGCLLAFSHCTHQGSRSTCRRTNCSAGENINIHREFSTGKISAHFMWMAKIYLQKRFPRYMVRWEPHSSVSIAWVCAVLVVIHRRIWICGSTMDRSCTLLQSNCCSVSEHATSSAPMACVDSKRLVWRGTYVLIS